jgi:hypothetical protein
VAYGYETNKQRKENVMEEQKKYLSIDEARVYVNSLSDNEVESLSIYITERQLKKKFYEWREKRGILKPTKLNKEEVDKAILALINGFVSGGYQDFDLYLDANYHDEVNRQIQYKQIQREQRHLRVKEVKNSAQDLLKTLSRDDFAIYMTEFIIWQKKFDIGDWIIGCDFRDEINTLSKEQFTELTDILINNYMYDAPDGTSFSDYLDSEFKDALDGFV